MRKAGRHLQKAQLQDRWTIANEFRDRRQRQQPALSTTEAMERRPPKPNVHGISLRQPESSGLAPCSMAPGRPSCTLPQIKALSQRTPCILQTWAEIHRHRSLRCRQSGADNAAGLATSANLCLSIDEDTALRPGAVRRNSSPARVGDLRRAVLPPAPPEAAQR